MIFVDRLLVRIDGEDPGYDTYSAFTFTTNIGDHDLDYIFRFVASTVPVNRAGYAKFRPAFKDFQRRSEDRALQRVFREILEKGAMLNGVYIIREKWRRLLTE